MKSGGPGASSEGERAPRGYPPPGPVANLGSEGNPKRPRHMLATDLIVITQIDRHRAAANRRHGSIESEQWHFTTISRDTEHRRTCGVETLHAREIRRCFRQIAEHRRDE